MPPTLISAASNGHTTITISPSQPQKCVFGQTRNERASACEKERERMSNESENTQLYPKNKQPYIGRAKEWKSGFYFTFISMHIVVPCKSLFSVIRVHFECVCVSVCGLLSSNSFDFPFRCAAFVCCSVLANGRLSVYLPVLSLSLSPTLVFPWCHFCDICVSLVFISLFKCSCSCYCYRCCCCCCCCVNIFSIDGYSNQLNVLLSGKIDAMMVDRI